MIDAHECYDDVFSATITSASRQLFTDVFTYVKDKLYIKCSGDVWNAFCTLHYTYGLSKWYGASRLTCLAFKKSYI